MKKFLTATVAAAVMSVFIGGAQAADYDQAIQELVVSGYVEKWTGYSFVSGAENNTNPVRDGYFASGTSGRLSLPLGSNLSMQMDAGIEYTENSFKSDNNDVFQHSGYVGAHLAYRDPNSFALGAFGSFGTGYANETRHDFYALGGEAQIYLNDITLYVQAGYLDGNDTTQPGRHTNAFHDAIFVRGVARWFLTPNSRLQGEFAYASGHQDRFTVHDMDIMEWGVRYDTMIAGLPLVGDTNVFVGYRGARFDNDGCGNGCDDGRYTDHTIMVGATYAFGGNTMQEFDRVGATFDLPNFGRWVASGQSVD